jgi:uncharacterized delta-60 repeat protein
MRGVTDSHIPWGARALLVGAAALVPAFFASATAFAGVADPDPSFSGDGRTTVEFAADASPDAVAITPDGDIVVAGSVEVTPDTRDFAVARLNADGSPDTAFSGDGRLTIDVAEGGDDYATGVAVRPDGRIVVAGTSAGRFAVIQLDDTGAPDDGFGNNGSAVFGFGAADAGEAHDVVLDASGNAVVVGSGSSEGDGGKDAAIARLTAAGELDGSFAGDGRLTAGLDQPGFQSSDAAFAVSVLPGGELAIAGSHFQVPDGRGLFGRIDSSGSVESLESLGTGRYYAAQDVATLADGTPLAAGYHQPYGGPGGSATVWAFGDLTGTDWAFAPAPDVRAAGRAIAGLPDGNAIVAGTIGSQGNLFLLDPDTGSGFVGQGATAFSPSELAVSGGRPVAVGADGGDFAVARFLAPTLDPADTRITGGPRGTIVGKAKFRFRADGDATAFQCKLDRRRWRACESPTRLRDLDPGRHRFKVRAISAAGGPDPTPAVRRFRVA